MFMEHSTWTDGSAWNVLLCACKLYFMCFYINNLHFCKTISGFESLSVKLSLQNVPQTFCRKKKKKNTLDGHPEKLLDLTEAFCVQVPGDSKQLVSLKTHNTLRIWVTGAIGSTHHFLWLTRLLAVEAVVVSM